VTARGAKKLVDNQNWRKQRFYIGGNPESISLRLKASLRGSVMGAARLGSAAAATAMATIWNERILFV
jgi:hypothetical protein